MNHLVIYSYNCRPMKLTGISLIIWLFASLFGSTFVQAQVDSNTTANVDPVAEELANMGLDSVPEDKQENVIVYKDDPIKFFDMGVYSTQEAFKSREVKRHNMWENIENDCGLDIEEIPIELTNAFRDISRSNQSSLYGLVKGNVKISNQVISPTERQFMFSPFLTAGSSSKIFGCLSGLSYREEKFIINDVDYFSLVLSNIIYLQEELQYNYHKNGRTYRCILIKNKEDMRTVLKDPTQIGILVSIGGGHSLGNYLYIEQDQVDTEEYQDIIISNIRKLKGYQPINTGPDEYLDIPILSVNFGNFFKDGICGKTARFSLSEEEAFKRPTTIDDDVTELGQAAIKEMLTKSRGRRILVDVGGMSLRSREWYYKYVKDQKFRKDTIPIVCTGVGISGLSNRDNSYGRNDKRELLNHQTYNLCRQDLTKILRSGGLIGISLERDKLMGRGFQSIYDETVPNSADRRRVAVNAIVANICKAIHMSNSIEAWDMLSISTQFDAHARHLDVFDSSADMVNLYRDLLDFFENPRDIPGLYSVKEIKNFMYNYSAEEIVNKIMYKNALDFSMRHLPEVEPLRP